LCLNARRYYSCCLSHLYFIITLTDCIELAAGTLPEGATHVTVHPVASIEDADTLEVEPLTTSDWESLEIYAEVLEEGSLLQQVSVVYPHQVLALHVGSEMVKVQVLTESPCRLLADTEVHIRPKPRPSGHKKSPLLRVVPSWEDYSPAMQNLALQINEGCTRIHVGPCTVLVHPTTLKESGFEDECIVMIRYEGSDGSQRDTAVARVHVSSLVAKDSVGECFGDN